MKQDKTCMNYAQYMITLNYRIINNTVQCDSICTYLLPLHDMVSCDYLQKA
jgi:hypothetical protein